MKRILIAALILLLSVSLISCGQGTQGEPAEDEPTYEDAITVSTGSQELTDPSIVKTASEEDIEDYFDVLYSENSIAPEVRKNAMNLFRALALDDIKKGTNTMISPLSFMTAMGLLENGAAGDSLKEIEDAFGYDTESFNEWYDAWSKMLLLNGRDSLKMANSVWYRSGAGLRVSDEYLKKAAEVFEAQAFEAAFDEETLKDINSWVSDKTDGMIPKLLDNLTEDSMMWLINATCFEGAWLKDYEDDQIIEGEKFTREDGTEDDATMLSSTETSSPYISNDFLKGTIKEYQNGFEIMFLLPDKGVSLEEALLKLEGDALGELRKNIEMADIDLMIPEFSFDYTAPKCVESLMAMGINTAFDENRADLSPMAVMDDGCNLYVDTVIHKTHIDLDREGTKAAAATGIGIAKESAAYFEVPQRELKLDRPFIFVISDTTTQTPVFIGTVGSLG